MKQPTIKIGIDLERELDAELNRWAAQEERSKRVQLRRIARTVLSEYKRDPYSQALRSIGLVPQDRGIPCPTHG